VSLRDQVGLRSARSTRITLVRHGKTDWNAEGRLQGQLQIPLNRRGRVQAEALATCLRRGLAPCRLHSDLLRTLQTAQAITRHSGHKIRADERLREWNLGVLVGLRRAQAEHDQSYGPGFAASIWWTS